MRARTFIYALICSTASAAFAQDTNYARFRTSSAEACAEACSRDRMCATWAFGSAPRSYGQRIIPENASQGSCTFSSLSNASFPDAIATGRPRPNTNVGFQNGPPTYAPAAMNNRAAYSRPPSAPVAIPAQQRPMAATSSANSNASPWAVRPAPWLSGSSGPAPQAARQMAAAPRRPYVAPPAPPPPQVPQQPDRQPPPQSQARIEFEAPPASVQPPQGLAPPPMTNRAPMQEAYVPPPAPQRPQPAPPRPMYQPQVPVYSPPPEIDTRALGNNGPPSDVPEGPPGTIAVPATGVADPAPTLIAPASSVSSSPKRRRAARGTPRSKAVKPEAAMPPAPPESPAVAAPEMAQELAVPTRQEVSLAPPPARGTPRAPVKDPYNPESFRGADGMIDAAEMRRAQLDAARQQGSNSYSVQSEWEAIEYERQRAMAAGETPVDPLAGTTPVPPPPETRSERRIREAEEAADKALQAAQEARANGVYGEAEADAAPAKATRKTMRKARGVPRKRAARQSDPPQSIDREPRLFGGPE